MTASTRQPASIVAIVLELPHFTGRPVQNIQLVRRTKRHPPLTEAGKMTLRGLIHRVKQLLTGNSNDRKQLLYLARMKLRGIDLDSESLESLGIHQDQSRYSDSGGPDLDIVLQSLTITPGDAVLDLGCGKGGPMLTMARYPFSRIDGVEISPDLVNAARENMIRAGIDNANVICCSATEFKDYDSYTYIYMYNPFPAVVMQETIKYIKASLFRRPRRLTIIYKNPTLHKMIAEAGFVKCTEFLHGETPFFIYTLSPQVPPE